MKIKLVTTHPQYLLLIALDTEIDKGYYLTDKQTVCEFIKGDDKYVYSLEAGSSTRKNCKSIIAYYPLVDNAKKLALPILKNSFNSINIDKLANDKFDELSKELDLPMYCKAFWIGGYKHAYKELQNNKFSVDNIIDAFDKGANVGALSESLSGEHDSYEEMEEAGNYFHNTRDSFIQSIRPLPNKFILGVGNTIEERITNGCYEF